MNLVSIIVPIYNVEPFLERCINSLLSQTYTNLEIILVDDGSPDNCPQICDDYACLDERIKVIHKTNGGLSDARNAGLKIATGEKIAFVDSDDWVAPYYIEVMIRAMEETSSDIVECNYMRTDGNEEIMKPHNDVRSTVYSTTEAMRHLIQDLILHQIVWNKLYKKSVISDVVFPLGKYNEDEFWTYQVFGKAKKIAKVENVLYYYFQNSDSIMGQGYKIKRLDAIEAKVLRQQYIDACFSELSDIAATNLLSSIIYAGQMSLFYLSDAEKKQAIRILQNYIKKIFTKSNYHFVGNIKYKIWLNMGIRNLKFTCSVRNFLRMNI